MPRGLLAQVALVQALPAPYIAALTVVAVRGLFGNYSRSVGIVALVADLFLMGVAALHVTRPPGRHSATDAE